MKHLLSILKYQERLVNRRYSTKLKWSYLHCASSESLRDHTIGRLVDVAADNNENHEAIVDVQKGVRKTFGQLKHDVDRLSAGFMNLGLKKGDRIGVWGPNSYEWYLTFFAAGRAGLVLVTLNPAYQAMETRYCLNKVGIKAIVCEEQFKSQNYYDLIVKAAPGIENSKPSKEVPTLERVIVITKQTLPGTHSFEEVLKIGNNKEDIKKVLDLQDLINIDEPCNIQFTSGTTGKPKAATLSHHNIVNNGYFVGRRLGMKYGKERLCVPVPLFHCLSNVGAVLNGFQHAATCVLPGQGFKADDALIAASVEKCTIMYGTPTMYVDMLNSPNLSKYDLSNLNCTVSSGSLCPVELMKDIKKKLGVRKLVSFYGMTETSPVSFETRVGDSDESRVTSVGYPGEHVEVKVVDLNNQIVPVGTAGELCIRGYLTMLGYWEDKEKTEEIMGNDRWLRTGDSFMLDENGYGYVVGRLKDMIIRGGENIYPKEIEEFLHTHPSIIEAQVFGIPDPRLGEELCLWLRLVDGETLVPEDIKQFCKGNLAHYKIPKYIHFTKTFPKTESGKIQKFKLQEESKKMFNMK